MITYQEKVNEIPNLKRNQKETTPLCEIAQMRETFFANLLENN